MHVPPLLPGERPASPPRTWWSRHWVWCLPVAMLLASSAVAAVIVNSFRVMVDERRASEPYSEAMRRVRCSPEVRERLGGPIEDGTLALIFGYGRMPDGTVSVANRLKGSYAGGYLMLQGKAEGDALRFHTLSVRFDDGTPIGLDTSGYARGGCPLLDAGSES